MSARYIPPPRRVNSEVAVLENLIALKKQDLSVLQGDA